MDTKRANRSCERFVVFPSTLHATAIRSRMPKPRLLAFLLTLLAAVLAVVFAAHAYLGSYTRFIADDYCSAYLGQRFGLLRYLWFWYLNWGGRFSAIAADMVLAWSRPQGIGWVPGTALMLWMAFLTAAIFHLLPGEMRRNRTFAPFLEWVWDGSERARSRAGFLLAGLAGTALALVILLAAPGNLNRQEAFYRPSGWVEMLQISLNGYAALLQSVLAAPARVVGLAGALLFFFSLGALHPASQPVAPRRLLLISALTVRLPAVSFLPAAYGIGDALPERAHDIPIFVLLAGAFVTAFLAGARAVTACPAPGPAVLAGVLLFASAAMILPTLIESRHAFIAYAERMDRVEQEILQARQNKRQVIHIPRLGNWAGTFDPTDNPRFFSTACISLYYDIQVLGSDPFLP